MVYRKLSKYLSVHCMWEIYYMDYSDRYMHSSIFRITRQRIYLE